MNGDRAETLHAGVLSVIEGLVKDDPEPDTQAGKALIALATAVEEYEKSVASERADIEDEAPLQDLMKSAQLVEDWLLRNEGGEIADEARFVREEIEGLQFDRAREREAFRERNQGI